MERIEFFQHDLGEAEAASVRRTLGSLFLTLGPRVAEFEEAFGRFLGGPRVVAVTSATVGLMLALEAYGIGEGDEVITTPMTFVATSNAILYVRAKPVFADVEPATGLIDPAAVESAITPRTKAIIVVHLYGQLCDMRRLRAIADRHKLVLIEDAAHCTEGEKDGARVADLGDVAVFSFYATKTMTCGDGGAVAVRDPAIHERLRRLRSHGQTKDVAARHGNLYVHWDMVELGHKAALTDIQAAILLPQIERLEARRELREAAVRRYERALEGRPGIGLVSWTGRSSHHLFTVLVAPEHRDRVLRGLGERGIGVGVNYRAVHTLAYYRERFGFAREAFPNAASIGDRTISLPLWPGLSDAQVDRVVWALGDALG
jgi:dTDP-4-amino-4,6-dideoxygalactose transaminase